MSAAPTECIADGGAACELERPALEHRHDLIESVTDFSSHMSGLGQVRKSAEVPETSAFGGEADVDFRRLDFRA